MIYCTVVKGFFAVNCYFLIDEATNHGFVIDPGAQGRELADYIGKNGFVIEKILLTHGHFDHIGGVNYLRKRFGIPVMIHEKGDLLLTDTDLNLSASCRVPMTVTGAEHFHDGDVIMLDANPNFGVRVIHTPGHTVDSCVLYCENEKAAFVGDTIFKGSYGEFRYPTGDYGELMQSIRHRILTLPPETVLLSGHSDPTTVEAERYLYE